jgi:tetratricopeptide (TPR) repeat protein
MEPPQIHHAQSSRVKRVLKPAQILAAVFSVLAFSCRTIPAQAITGETGPENILEDENIKIAGVSPMAAPTENVQAMVAYNKGTVLLGNNELDEAEKYLKEAIDLDPLFVDAMDHLGLVYRRQRRYDDAEKIYLQSIAINRKNTVPYQNLAIVYRLQNRLEDAFEQYRQIMEIEPENPESYYGIGELFQITGDYERSIPYFDTAIEKYIAIKSGLVYDALYCQGLNYYRLNRYETALRYLEEVQRAGGNNEELNELIEKIRAEMSKT